MIATVVFFLIVGTIVLGIGLDLGTGCGAC